MRRWLSAVVRIRCDALRGDQHRGRIAGRGVVDDLIEIEGRRRHGAGVFDLRSAVRIRAADPFVGLARIVEAQVVVDRLGRQHGRQPFGQRLQAVQRAVAADRDQPLDAELRQTLGNQIELGGLVRVDVVARGADQRATLGGIELRDLLKQRIQVQVRHPRVEEAVETLDQAVDLDAQLIGADHGAVDRRVQRRRVTAGGQNADAFHERAPLVQSTSTTSCMVRAVPADQWPAIRAAITAESYGFRSPG